MSVTNWHGREQEQFTQWILQSVGPQMTILDNYGKSCDDRVNDSQLAKIEKEYSCHATATVMKCVR